MTLRRAFPRLAAVLSALPALAACSLGPAYQAPALDLPAAFRASAEHAAAVWPQHGWWSGFGSAELDALVADAREKSFDIQAAIARVRQADAQVRIAGAPLLPTVSVNGEDQYTRSGSRARGSGLSTLSGLGGGGSGGGSHYTDSRSYSLLFSTSYEIDFWGRLRAAQESAEASALYSRFDQETVAQTTINSIVTSYFTALADQDRLAVAQRNLRDSEDILRAIQARESVGTASLLDVSQQAALAAGIRATIPNLRSAAEQEAIGLATLVGRNPEAITVGPGTLTTLSLPDVAPGLPSDLLLRRPDIASAEAQLIAANADIRAARADFFPQITLTGQAGWESTALTSLISPGAALFQVAASAAQTIFDNGTKGGTYEKDRARYDELLADYRKAVVQALVDVETALVAYRYATEQEALQQQAVDVAQRAADIARAQVEAGTSDIVTALQAETTLFTDLDTLAQVRLTRFTALADLYKALGGGWSRAETPVPPSTIYHGVL